LWNLGHEWKMPFLLMMQSQKKHQKNAESLFGIMWIFKGYDKKLNAIKVFFYILTIYNLPTTNPSLVGLRSNLVLLFYMAFYHVVKGCNHSHSLGMESFFNFLIVKQNDPNSNEMGN
jgi:hypothetical protein